MREMAPGLGDLPAGYRLVEETFLSNEESARNSAKGQVEALRHYEEWGRLMAYSATYEDRLGRILGIGTVLYRDEGGAIDGFNWLPTGMTREEYISTQTLAYFANAPQNSYLHLQLDADTTQISFTSLGDESSAWEVAITGEAAIAGDMGTTRRLPTFFNYCVRVRHDRASGVVCAMTLDLGKAPHLPDTITLAELEEISSSLALRMAAALQ